MVDEPRHPNLNPGEVYVGNVTLQEFFSCEFKTKRTYGMPLDTMGRVLGPLDCVLLRPLFVQRKELEDAGFVVKDTGFGVFFVCILLFFVALFAMMAIVGIAEAISNAVTRMSIEKRKRAFAPLRESRVHVQVFDKDKKCLHNAKYVIPHKIDVFVDQKLNFTIKLER